MMGDRQRMTTGDGLGQAGIEAEDGMELWEQLDTDTTGSVRAALIDRYLPLARTIAAGIYSRRMDNDVPFDDYLQHANLGLIEAVGRFDSSRGVSFSTYATYRIRGSVLNGLDSETERRHQQAFYRRLQRERRRSLLSEDGETGKDGLEELATLTVHLLLGVLLDEGEPVDPETGAAGVGEPRALDELRLHLNRALGRLPERERTILRHHYFYQMPFSELGSLLGLSKGRISQLHRQALVRLRALLGNQRRLDDYF